MVAIHVRTHASSHPVVLPSFTKSVDVSGSQIKNWKFGKKTQLVHTKIYQVSIKHDFQLFQFFITEAAILPVDLPQLLNHPTTSYVHSWPPEMGPQKNGRGYLHLQDLNSLPVVMHLMVNTLAMIEFVSSKRKIFIPFCFRKQNVSVRDDFVKRNVSPTCERLLQARVKISSVICVSA